VTAAGLVRAAGAGRRFGGPKALAALAGEPLVRHAVRLLREGGCDDVTVVVGACAEQVAALVPDCAVVTCAEWSTGMAASLRAGLDALAEGPHEAAVVALVDQPRLGAEAVRRLLAASGPAAVATYAGRPRNPVRLDREVWAEVSAAVHDDEGARRWLAQNASRVVAVPCDGTGSPEDVDTAEDLQALVEQEEQASS
jgi:CTP:molybdopterin cytidylyltransferase MocA